MKDSRALNRTQEEFLKKVIRQNEKTLYGLDHDFAAIRDVRDFRRKHPLTRYAHYEPYVAKIRDEGVKDAMTFMPTEMLAVTSGTSGKSNLIPTNSYIPSTFFLRGKTETLPFINL